MFNFLKKWLPARDEAVKPRQISKQAIAMLRREYDGLPLDESTVLPDPVSQFTVWFEEVLIKIKQDPNAMILSVCDNNSRPSSRTVLLKGFDENGFIFYTNYKSRKGLILEENPYVSLTFFWADLMRQVHVEGRVEKTDENTSDEYFQSRPVSSKLGAWASDQSRAVSGRKELEERLKEAEKKFAGKHIPRPPYWGGYRVIPERVEFWQGRLNRLHDRICYTKIEDHWKITRLMP
jgi:pyridoxamine 5'-phosphate oxidase